MRRAFIAHCWDGYPEYCWYPSVRHDLEERGIEVVIPAFPDTHAPQLNRWMPVLAEAVDTPDEETYLIGHSVGCVTILWYLASLGVGEVVDGVILVAGFTDDLGFKELSNFFPKELPYADIKTKANDFVAIHSDNDPYVPLKHGEILKEKLGARLIIKPGGGHFSGSIDDEETCADLPEVVENVLGMAC